MHIACNFIKKETLEQGFSCEFCEIFKNTFFNRTFLVDVSASATHINANLPFQYNHLEQSVSENFDWVDLNGCIEDVDIKESTYRGEKK